MSLLIVCGFLASVWSGCGESSEPSSVATEEPDAPKASAQAESPPEVTKKDYIAAADELCESFLDGNIKLAEKRGELSEEAASTPSAQTAKQIQDIVLQQVENREQLTKEIEALEEPASGGAERYIESRGESTKKIAASAEAWGAYADQLDDASVVALNEAIDAESESVEENTKFAREYGFEVCGALILQEKK